VYAEPTVFVVDDDQAMRSSLSRLMQSVGLRVEAYASAAEFLNAFDSRAPGCLVLDIRMPGMDGLELQERLAADGIRIPVIIISAHGDVESAVRAMKCGAVDFVKKPYKGKVLLARIREALELDARIRGEQARQADVIARLARLTPREREVLALLVLGKSAKQIAFELGLSRKTVDVHRSHVMAKMQTDSVVELVAMSPFLQREPKVS
jgi:FixJ family two-component response regulator